MPALAASLLLAALSAAPAEEPDLALLEALGGEDAQTFLESDPELLQTGTHDTEANEETPCQSNPDNTACNAPASH